MKAGARWVMIAWAVVCMGGVAHAQLKGQQWVDKKFESYNVKKIGLMVSGTWKGASAKVDPSKISGCIAERLERKGYEVVILKKEKGEKEAPVDATLKVLYKSMSVGSLGAVEEGSGKGVELKDYSVSGSVQLSLATGTKKVIFKAAATTSSQFKDGGTKDGTQYIDVGDPAEEFAKIVNPIPNGPGATEKEGKEGEKAGEKEKKDEGGKKEKKGDGEK